MPPTWPGFDSFYGVAMLKPEQLGRITEGLIFAPGAGGGTAPSPTTGSTVTSIGELTAKTALLQEALKGASSKMSALTEAMLVLGVENSEERVDGSKRLSPDVPSNPEAGSW